MQTSQLGQSQNRSSLQERVLYRSLGSKRPFCQLPGLYADKQWINDIDIVEELKGHAGCVNTLCWSQTGEWLASGSDDTHVNIYSYQSGDDGPFRLKTTIHTGHRANIFSVKFMPHSGDQTIVTCSGDHTVRVFDLEYANRFGDRTCTGPSVQTYHHENTNCRVYSCHTDSVKRIVTESSPYLFLTCSEDGDVRRWDTRESSLFYPRPGPRGEHSMEMNIPPPLISYRRYGIELNTISCSRNQPHYIALGGSHLHCFLHDGRMAGRDLLSEHGVPYSSSRASVGTTVDNTMDSATRCVRRFAPDGLTNQTGLQRHFRQITACKISDANPDEIIVSWSADHIYSFDMIRNMDARESRDQPRGESLEKSAPKHKRSATNTEPTSVAVNTENAHLSPKHNHGHPEYDVSLLTPDEIEALDIAYAICKIRRLLFGKRIMQSSQSTRAILQKVENVARQYSERARTILRAWRYPLNPSPATARYQKEMRNIRQNAYRFTQIAAGLANAYRKRCGEVTISTLDEYPDRQLEPSSDENRTHFCYEFLRTIVAFSRSGRDGIYTSFVEPPDRRNARLYPVGRGIINPPAEQIVIAHLLEYAGNRPIMDVDRNRFENDSARRLFRTEQDAVNAYARVMHDACHDVLPYGNSSGPDASSEDYEFWLLKVGRALLLQATKDLNIQNINTAFGGVHWPRHILQERGSQLNDMDDEDDDLEYDQEEIEVEEINPEEITYMHDLGEAYMSTLNQLEDLSRHDDQIISDDDTIQTGQGIVETMDHIHQNDEGHDDDDNNEDDSGSIDYDDNDSSESGDYDETDENEDSDDFEVYRRPYELRYASSRSGSTEIEQHAPCFSHMKKYVGHCNIQTVKDVNYFGQNDEYVVSGSDSGHLFIWDKKTAEVVNILAGDSEVVNVIQGHPYEPTLAVAGIDNTIKIFSPDRRAQRYASLGARNHPKVPPANRSFHATADEVATPAEDTLRAVRTSDDIDITSPSSTDTSAISRGDDYDNSGEDGNEIDLASPTLENADAGVPSQGPAEYSDDDSPYDEQNSGLKSRKRMHEKDKIMRDNENYLRRTDESTLFAGIYRYNIRQEGLYPGLGFLLQQTGEDGAIINERCNVM